MYHRRGFYPRAGQADVPDDLWAEFQKIRGNLSNLDQNNVDAKTLEMETIVPPTDPDHNGVSDIVGVDGSFLYKSVNPLSSLYSHNFGDSAERWIDLGEYGLALKAQSRGDAPWIVGASLDAIVLRAPYTTENPLGTDITGSTFPTGPLPVGGPATIIDRANLRLRVKSSQDGLSVAEAVGGFNKYVFGCSIAMVTSVLSRGGEIEFSPSIRYDEVFRTTNNIGTWLSGGGGFGGGSDYSFLPLADVEGGPTSKWGLRISRANIFAFALYK